MLFLNPRARSSTLRYLHTTPESIQKVLEIAHTYLNKGEFAKARDHLQKHESNHTFTQNKEFQFLSMKAVIEANKMGKYAFATTNIFFGEFSEKIHLLTSNASNEPFDPGFSSDDFIDSMATHLQSTSSRQWDSETSERLFYEGMIHFAKAEWKAAKNKLQKISGLPEADLKLGHLMLLQGKPDAAFNFYARTERELQISSLTSSPLGVTITYELMIGQGFAYIQKGEWTKGCKIIREAYEKNRTKTANNLIGWLTYQAPYLYFSAPHLSRSKPHKFRDHGVFQNIFNECKRLDTLTDRQSAEKDLELTRCANFSAEIVMKIYS